MDLTRTGVTRQQQMENALAAHIHYMGEYIRAKQYLPQQDRSLTDFAPFQYRDTGSLAACLSRNRLQILNLALLAILGFAGAYVTIIRYDVR
jgi:hypothetical protein